VIHDATGCLVPVGDRAGFAKHAEKLLSDPALADRLATAARGRVAREFSVAKMVWRHVALYRELLG
jgi:glycosyltransferase involved in cell wall biosynthesis